jgi:hypothetical protein
VSTVQQGSASAASREAKKHEGERIVDATTGKTVRRIQTDGFRLSGAETLHSAIADSFSALNLHNWNDVKDELQKFIEAHYVPRALFEKALRGEPIGMEERKGE